MGKIRIKTLGDEDLEKEQKKEAKKRQDAKKAVKSEKIDAEPEETVKAKEPEQEEKKDKKVSDSAKQTKKTRLGREARQAKFTEKKRQKRSRKYQAVASIVDKNKIYSLNEALEVLPKLKISNFDETVELHINTTEKGVSGNLNLPHGTGKKARVAIADDKLISEIEKGKIDFDVLLAEPSMMPKLAKVARVLGPRGLMPNPKNGTISANPEQAAKKFEGGQTNFKTEAKNPIIHLAVGKLSFGDKKLEENIKATLNAIQASKIRKVVLKSTMSPGIKIDFTK